MVGTMTSSRGAALSSFAAPSSAGGGNKPANVRVVARIRPLLEHERHRRSCLTTVETEERSTDSFATPSKNVSSSIAATPVIRNTRQRDVDLSPQNRSFSVANMSYGNATSMMAGKDDVQRQFSYDAVFSPEASQKEVYDRSVGDAVRRNIFRGYNTTIIAYGQSASGKTYTMSGQKEADKMAPSPVGSSFVETFNFDKLPSKDDYSLGDDDGIIPRAIHDLFKAKQRHESAGEVSISLTYMEIYNEELRDLLVDEHPQALKLRDSGEEGFFVVGLSSVLVKSAKHARDLMDAATTRRRTSSTKLNLRSSRSHAICTLTVSINPALNSQTTSADTIGSRGSEIITAKLTMVDLAGSERIKQSGVTGIAQKESININKDLFVLAKVVSALADKSNLKKTVHVPYRDSKLTRLLRDSLGGNCCTVVVSCVSPSDVCFEESINTLRYAERTRAITNSVKQNVNKAGLTPAEYAALRGENRMLKVKLLTLKNRVHLLENNGSERSVDCGSMSLDGSQGSVDDLYMSASGDTAESSTTGESSLGSRIFLGEKLDRDIEQKQITLDRSNRDLSESESMLRSKGLLMGQPSIDLIGLETKMDEAVLGEQRIARSLKAENNKLRKENNDIMDCIHAREADGKHLAEKVLNHQNEIKEAEVRRNALRYESARMEERLQQLPPEVSALRLLRKSTAAAGQVIEMATMPRRPKPSVVPIEVERLQSKLNKTNAEVKDSKVKLNSANARITELEQLEKTFIEQIMQMATIPRSPVVPNEVERLQSKLSQTNAEAKDSKVKLDSANARITELEQLEKNFMEQIMQLRDDLKNGNRYRVQFEKDLETLMTEIEELTKERDNARIKAAIHHDEKENLQGSLHAKDALIAELREELSESQSCLEQQQQSDCAASEEAAVGQKIEDALSEASGSLKTLDDPSTTLGSSSTPKDIRVHATKMLFYANQAIEKGRSSRSVASSIASSNASDLKPDIRELQAAIMKSITLPRTVATAGKPPLASRPEAEAEFTENKVMISNMEKVENSNCCSCHDSLFSGNAAHANFYLPKLGMACACGHHKQGSSTLDGNDPTALANILRPWQVEFLATLDIRNSIDLVHAHNQRGEELAKAMRRWRKENKLASVKTKSCNIALHIWSRTCKAVVRSVRKQKADGAKVFKKPEFLEISSDTRTISTIGYGSVIDMNTMMEV